MRYAFNLLKVLDKFISFPKVYAHCDVPCGLYSPEAAIMAANTVAKMVEKIQALPKENPSQDDRNFFVRMVATKEQHAEICKRELLILWTDYFKQEHLAIFPNLHETFWKAAKLCSKNKQSVSAEAAAELQRAVAEIAETFHKVEADTRG